MAEDTSQINLTLDGKEREALTRALDTYARHHRDLATEVDQQVLATNHHAWASYFTDLAATVHDGQGFYSREDLLRISEALDQYSGELPSDLRSVENTVSQQLHNTGPRAHTSTAIQHQKRSKAWNQPGARNHLAR